MTIDTAPHFFAEMVILRGTFRRSSCQWRKRGGEGLMDGNENERGERQWITYNFVFSQACKDLNLENYIRLIVYIDAGNPLRIFF